MLPNTSGHEHGPVSVAAPLAALVSHVSGTPVLLWHPKILYNTGQFSSETFLFHITGSKKKIFQNKEVKQNTLLFPN